MVKNLTQGNPVKLIILFTLPLLIGNVFQQLYSLADSLIVGRAIGIGALAAIGCTASINFLMLGFVMGFCQGASVITSQRFGAGDEKGVRKSFAVIITICIAFSICITLLSTLTARPMLELLRTPEDIIDNAHLYIVIIFAGIPITMFYNALSSVMRAVGDSRTALVFLVTACIINIIIDFLFIVHFKMGVEGAAIATILAQFLTAISCFLFIYFRMPVLQIHKTDWSINRHDIAAHLKLAVPFGFQMSIIAIGTITVTFVLNQMGTITLAAYTAAARIDMVATALLFSFGMAMATYTAQNYGAGKPDRIQKGIRYVLCIAFCYCVIIALVFRFTGSFFPSIFLGRKALSALTMANSYLTINSAFYMLLGTLFITRSSLQGLGDSLTPTIAGVMELAMRIFAALFLGKLFGFKGVCFANPLAWLGALIPLLITTVRKVKRLTTVNP